MMRTWLTLVLLLALAAGTVAQPGRVGGSVAFRVFTPTGQLVTPAAGHYQVGFGDAPGTYFAGLHRIRKVGNPTRSERPAYYYDSTGVYRVEPPDGDFGAPVSDAFRLYVARGTDTMFIYPPSIRLRHIWLDSVPFRPGTYYLTGFLYQAAAFVQPQGLRLSPGPRADWRALQQPVPAMYLQQVADLGAGALRKWQRRRSAWDSVQVRNGRKCRTWQLAERPYQDGLQRVGAGPLAYYYGWLTDRTCMFLLGNQQAARTKDFRLFEIREAIDSAQVFPFGKSFERGPENLWHPPRFLLDTVFYEQAAWYALVVRSFEVLRPGPAPCIVRQVQYVKCRLWRSDELSPAQLTVLQRQYIEQLPAGYWSQEKARKATTYYSECDWLPPCD